MSCASIPHRRGKTCRTLEKCAKTAFFYFLQVFSKICLTNASDMRIITHVDRLTQPGGTTDGDLHSGSAVDSDSTCGSSILSSPTKNRSRTSCGIFRGIAQLVARLVRDEEAVGSNPAAPTKRHTFRGVSFFLFVCKGCAGNGSGYSKTGAFASGKKVRTFAIYTEERK